MPLHVDSEVGTLKQVMLHEPGLELDRLTPQNCDELLFDDVMWARKAREEHRAFADQLEMKGIKVHLFRDKLGEALEVPAGREFLLDRVARPESVGPELVEPLRELAMGVSGAALASFMIGGILKKDLQLPKNANLLWSYLDDNDFVLTPLPNHLFQRDNTAFCYSGLSVHPMAKPARQREIINSRTVWNYHPELKNEMPQFYYGNDDKVHQPATIEGGDVLVIGNGSVMIGMGERSTPQGIGILTKAYFSAPTQEIQKVIVVELPKTRSLMHLDTAMTMIDKDKFSVYSELPELRTYTLEKVDDSGDYTIKENPEGSLWSLLAEAVGVEKMYPLITPIDELGAAREQWNDGNNFLTVAPGVIFGYERNETTNGFLARHGIEIVGVMGNELGRGRGGPRCMSCPMERGSADE